MIKLNNRTRIFADSFLIPKEEKLSFKVSILNTDINFILNFKDDSKESKATGSWTFENDTLNMVFSGWKSPLGASLKRPNKLGTIKNEPFGFNMIVFNVGEVYFVHFEIYSGGEYND